MFCIIVINLAIWIVVGFSYFMFFSIIKYLKSKSLASQTVLDEVYVLLFYYYMVCYSVGCLCLTIIQVIGEIPWAFAFILGWAQATIHILLALQIFIAMMVKFCLVYYASNLNNFSDRQILRICRYVCIVSS